MSVKAQRSANVRLITTPTDRLIKMPTQRLTKRAYVDLLRTASAACRPHTAS